MNKKHFCYFLAIVFILLFILLSFLLCNTPSANNTTFKHTYNDLLLVFEDDYDELIQVVEYLVSLKDIPNAYIYDALGQIDIGFGNEIKITDEYILEVISSLFEKGYVKIAKKNNTIYFERWKNDFGCFRGFSFSNDGTGNLDIEFLTVQESLNKADWYYYVSDYEAWRVQN